MGCIFDHPEVIMAGDLQDAIHVAGLPRDVDGDDRLGLGGKRFFDLIGINIEGILATVH